MSTERTNQIDAAASAWLVRRDSGIWSAIDQTRLEEWLTASILNRVAFLRLELAWEDAARLKALGAGVPGETPPPPGCWNLTPFFDPHSTVSSDDPQTGGAEIDSARAAVEESPLPTKPDWDPTFEDALAQPQTGNGQLVEIRGSDVIADPAQALHPGPLAATVPPAEPLRHRGRRRFTLAVAATLLLAIGISSYLALGPKGERYATPIGGLASVPMADGSTVTLNTDSQVRIALTDTERQVELGHGEAFFEVSKDPRRPFIVRAGSKRVIAVGTKFSVRREGDDIEVVVTEGKVRVEDRAASQGSRAVGSADVLLTPGSIARADEAGVLVQRKTLLEAEEQLSWRTGMLMLRNQSLGEAAAEFNRYNSRKIVIQDSTVASLKIEGNFRATNAEAFVRLVQSGFPVRAEMQPDQIVLMAK